MEHPCYLFLLVYLHLVTSISFNIQDDNSHVNVTFGDVLLVVKKSPWQLKVLDKTTHKPIITETPNSEYRLKFGKWEGVYPNIYEGYLFHVGLVTEWHSAEKVEKWSNTSDTVNFIVSTDDPDEQYLNVSFSDFQNRQFRMKVSVEGQKADESNRVSIGFLTPHDEGFYGFGERFTGCNQRGHRVGSWLEDGSWGLGVFDPATWKLRVPAGEESTYCPMPILYSTYGYAIQMDTYYRTVYDLSKSVDDVMLLEQESNSLNMIIFLSRNPQEAVTMVTEINGKSLIPPPWEFGPWNQLQDEDPSKTQSQRIEEFFFKYDIPCSHAINTVHFFPHGGEKGREQELKKENDKLLSLGVKSTAYFNAMLETGYTELYNYAATHDYLLKNEDGLPYNYSYIGASKFFVSQIDFTNPQAVTWYQQQLERSVNLSFHGWMYDYGEYTPHDSVSHDGTYGLKMHNEFSHLYQKAAFDYLTTLDPNPNDEYAPDYVFYVRSSYTGSQKYTWAHWTGDPSSDWSYASGLPAQITASLNIGLSGMPFSGSDIGGFEWYVDPAPDLDLWSRWTAAGCVSGLMHEQGGGKGTGPKSHIFDFPNGTLIWRKFAKLRMQLFPYIYTQAHISHDTGLPIMRHHLIQFWNDSKAISQNQQYMFGDVFLTAPVVDENKKSQIVYLPSYNSTDRPGPLWIDVGSGFIYDEQDGRYRIGFTGYHNGGQLVNVPVLLDNVPLFVMAGSIVPILDPRVMTLNNATNDSVITWNKLKHIRHVWVFVDENFNASGHSWDTDVYKLTHYQTNLLIFNIIGAPNDYIHIIQIAGPWKSLGLPVSVETDSHEIEVVKGWEQLVQDNSGEGYYYDDINSVLWLRLVIHETAKIHINNL